MVRRLCVQVPGEVTDGRELMTNDVQDEPGDHRQQEQHRHQGLQGAAERDLIARLGRLSDDNAARDARLCANEDPQRLSLGLKPMESRREVGRQPIRSRISGQPDDADARLGIAQEGLGSGRMRDIQRRGFVREHGDLA